MLPYFLLIAVCVSRIYCLEVTNTSQCAGTCNGPSQTIFADLSCSDGEYWSTANGVTFRNCLECESTSTAESGDTSTPQDNDIYWFLFNMKISLQWCMFGTGNANGSTPNLPQCQTDCAGLYPVLTTTWFTTPPAKQYQYCSLNNSAFPANADRCSSCLKASEGSVMLGNYLDTMQSACNKQPDASLGETVPLQRPLFATATVGTATASSTSSATTGPGSTPTNSSNPAQTSQSSSSGLSSGAAAGIGVGCGLLAIAAAAGLGWFFLRRRRRDRTSLQPQENFQHQKPKPEPGTETMSSYASYQPAPPYGQPASPQAQTPYTPEMESHEMESHEIHEMDSRPGTQPMNELDSRPVQRL